MNKKKLESEATLRLRTWVSKEGGGAFRNTGGDAGSGRDEGFGLGHAELAASPGLISETEALCLWICAVSRGGRHH